MKHTSVTEVAGRWLAVDDMGDGYGLFPTQPLAIKRSLHVAKTNSVPFLMTQGSPIMEWDYPLCFDLLQVNTREIGSGRLRLTRRAATVAIQWFETGADCDGHHEAVYAAIDEINRTCPETFGYFMNGGRQYRWSIWVE